MDPACDILRRMMEQKGVTVNELARRVGKAQNTVSAALKTKNIGFENFAEYVEALGYEMFFKDEDGEKLMPRKDRCAPPTTIVIGKFKYSTMTSEPIVCAEQTDCLFAELYRKASHDYFIVYFEKGGRGTVNPISENAARAFWRQYKTSEDKDEELD
jgi:transcriptional regulator with XRE-family HTH domain